MTQQWPFPPDALVFGFTVEHEVGKTCDSRCPVCPPGMEPADEFGRVIAPRPPMFILGVATREQWIECLKRRGGHNVKQVPKFCYFVSVD
jgi:hypothetical protein